LTWEGVVRSRLNLRDVDDRVPLDARRELQAIGMGPHTLYHLIGP
jgi:hypothetical protein